MIGVQANEDELEVAREFFELFKTPWEPVTAGRKYQIVLSTGGEVEHFEPDVLFFLRCSRKPDGS